MTSVASGQASSLHALVLRIHLPRVTITLFFPSSVQSQPESNSRESHTLVFFWRLVKWQMTFAAIPGIATYYDSDPEGQDVTASTARFEGGFRPVRRRACASDQGSRAS